MYEETRGNIESEVFGRINPTYPQQTSSVSLILGGPVASAVTGTVDFGIDTESVKNTLYTVEGVGFLLSECEDSLASCEAVWIPIRDSEGELHEVRFEVHSRSYYRDWVYLWNTGSSAFVSGSWIVDGIHLEEHPYDDGTGSTGRAELDYRCVVDNAGRSVLFVDYVPRNFEYNGEYNALLNNAISTSLDKVFTVSGSLRSKKYVFDFHKNPEIGGIHAGALEVPGGLASRIAQKCAYLSSFSKSAIDGTFQTLDLAFMNYRTISASVYVDREEFALTKPIEQIWRDLQEGNTDDPETVYFIPRSELVMDDESVPYPNPRWVFGEVQQVGPRSTVPVIGNILFTVDKNNPVRYVRATVYSPFINTVFRTDEYGVVSELFSGSLEDSD